jgi:preprotein translocase subunit SecY
MFGISPLGWVHTLGSLPAIPAAAYMLSCHGRIVPRSGAGTVYFISMLIGAATVFLVTHQVVGYGIGAATLLLLLAGYGVGRIPGLGRAARYIETICLSLTAFLLMLPTITETLRRVPDGHPLVTDLQSPLLLGSQASLLVILVVGLTAQIVYLRRSDKRAAHEMRTFRGRMPADFKFDRDDANHRSFSGPSE